MRLTVDANNQEPSHGGPSPLRSDLPHLRRDQIFKLLNSAASHYPNEYVYQLSVELLQNFSAEQSWPGMRPLMPDRRQLYGGVSVPQGPIDPLR